MKISRKKLLVGIVAMALAAIVSISALTLTWTSCSITMHAGTASVVTIAQFEDCACTIPLNSHDWDGVTQGNYYQLYVFVKNTGTEGVYLTYLPTIVTFYDGQAIFVITVTALEMGGPCQLYLLSPPVPLPEKNIGSPSAGLYLAPGKVVKLDVTLFVQSVVSGGVYDWIFTIYGAVP